MFMYLHDESLHTSAPRRDVTVRKVLLAEVLPEDSSHLRTFCQPQSQQLRARTRESFLLEGEPGQHIAVSTTLQIPPASPTPVSFQLDPSVSQPPGFSS